MKRFLLPLLVLSAQSVPTLANAESCYGIIGGKRVSLGAMCGDTHSSQPDTRGFLRELRKAVASDRDAVAVVDFVPQNQVRFGMQYCEQRRRFSVAEIMETAEEAFDRHAASETVRFTMRNVYRLAERYLCR